MDAEMNRISIPIRLVNSLLEILNDAKDMCVDLEHVAAAKSTESPFSSRILVNVYQARVREIKGLDDELYGLGLKREINKEKRDINKDKADLNKDRSERNVEVHKRNHDAAKIK